MDNNSTNISKLTLTECQLENEKRWGKLEVKLKEQDKRSEIIDLATKNDVKNVQNIVFSLEDANNTCNSLMAQALKLAQSRAQYIAKSGGLELLKPKSISPYCSVSSNSTTPRMYANASFKAEGTSYDTANVVESIEPGVLDARANVNMVYYLKQCLQFAFLNDMLFMLALDGLTFWF